jgi:hypothetical protein
MPETLAPETGAKKRKRVKAKAGTTRVYAYGALAPTEGLELVAAQMRLAHKYRNKLCEIERLRRDEVDAVVNEHYPNVKVLKEQNDAVKEELEEARTALKAVNKKARKRATTPEQRQHVKDLFLKGKEVYAAYKAARAVAFADPAVKAALEATNVADKQRVRAARKEFVALGLDWGTYLHVEASCRSFRSKAPPEFRRWNGDGHLAVQCQKGRSVEEVLSCTDSRVRVRPVPEAAHVRPGKKKGDRKLQRTEVWVRIGSEGRKPVWAKLPIVLHRPFPEDARVQWVHVLRRRIATHDKWSVQFVLSRPSWERGDVAAGGGVGVNIGWRVKPEGLRVAFWKGSDGAKGELIIPNDELSRWTRTETLQSTRDQLFDQARDQFCAWLAVPENAARVPEWMTEAVKFLPQWRSKQRLARVVVAWRTQRFDGDAAVFEVLEAWRKKDRHLYDWQENHRTRTLRWRTDVYRKFAVELREKYSTVVVCNTRYTTFQRKKKAENETGEDTAAREHRAKASPGALRGVLLGSGMKTIVGESKHITQRCHNCGGLTPFDAAGNLEHTCKHCAATWDQDENAATNLLGLFLTPSAGPTAS